MYWAEARVVLGKSRLPHRVASVAQSTRLAEGRYPGAAVLCLPETRYTLCELRVMRRF